MINEYLAVFYISGNCPGFYGSRAGNRLFWSGILTQITRKKQHMNAVKNLSGGAWIQFNMRYYFFAILFVIFDVDSNIFISLGSGIQGIGFFLLL